jgi:hypothetical protein
MNHQIRLLSILAPLAVVALAVSAPASAAEDYKVFTTMNCKPNGTAAANDLTYSYWGVLNTSSTDNRVVICPLIKDSDSTDNTTPHGTVTISYRTPGSSTGTVNCTVYNGYYPNTYYSASSSEGVVAANSYREFELGLQNAPTNYLAPTTLVCTLSPRTRLLRFIVHETAATNTP